MYIYLSTSTTSTKFRSIVPGTSTTAVVLSTYIYFGGHSGIVLVGTKFSTALGRPQGSSQAPCCSSMHHAGTSNRGRARNVQGKNRNTAVVT